LHEVTLVCFCSLCAGEGWGIAEAGALSSAIQHRLHCPALVLSVCLSVCLSICLSVCLSIYMSVCLLSVCLCARHHSGWGSSGKREGIEEPRGPLVRGAASLKAAAPAPEERANESMRNKGVWSCEMRDAFCDGGVPKPAATHPRRLLPGPLSGSRGSRPADSEAPSV